MDKFPQQNKKEIFSKSGQLLVEAVIAIFIIIVAIVTFMGLLSRSVGLNRIITDRYVAVYLAVEGLEIVENMIGGNYLQGKAWNDGFSVFGEYELTYDSLKIDSSQDSYQGRFLIFHPETGIYDYKSPGDKTSYKRKIVITPIDNDNSEVKVNSIVSWQSAGMKFEVNLERHFFDWRLPPEGT